MTAARVVIGAALVVGLGCRARPDEPAAATVAVASDAGGAEPRAIDPPAAVDALAPALVAIDGGALATWLEPIAGGHRLQVARWQGGAWSAPVTISAGAAIVASWADVPTLGVAGDGALVASWTEATGPEGYDAIVARSIDGGATWMRLGPLHGDHTATEHGFVAIAADGAGARAFWLDGRATATGGATALRTARVDGRVTDETVLDARVCDCCATAAAASAAGPIVAFRDRSPADLRDVVVASPDADGWRATGAAVDGWEITGCPVNGPALAARARTVATAWYTAAGGVPRVRAAFSGDGGATFAAAIDLDAPTAARVPLGRVAIVLAGDDAVASWVAAAGDDAAIWLRRVAADGRLGAARAIATLPAARTAGTPASRGSARRSCCSGPCRASGCARSRSRTPRCRRSARRRACPWRRVVRFPDRAIRRRRSSRPIPPAPRCRWRRCAAGSCCSTCGPRGASRAAPSCRC